MRALQNFCHLLILPILLFSFASIAWAVGSSSYLTSFKVTQPIYESPSDLFELYLNGYMQGDIMDIDNAPQLKGDANWRAGRVGMALDFYKKWQINLSYDFALNQLINANVTYTGASHCLFIVGQMSPVFGLENTSDTPAITFLELGLPTQAFSTSYPLGGTVGFFYDPITVYASIFGPQLGTAYSGHAPYGGTVSVSFSPIHTDARAFHLSLSDWQQGTDSSHTVDFSTIPEVMAHNQGTLINTGPIGNVKNYQVIDGAIAGVYGPFSAQSEYVHTWANRQPGFFSPQFQGYYVTAGYFLTGESRNYSFEDAGFTSITKINHSYGAWELAIRYSELNLIDRNIRGGQEHDYTVGLNWYPIQPITFKINYIHAVATPNSNGANQTANFYVLRLQVLL